MKAKVIVVGAGSVGSFVAGELAEKNIGVIVIDSNKGVGQGNHSGLVSTNVESLFNIKFNKIPYWKINGVSINCGKEQLAIEKKREIAYVVDMHSFNERLQDRAEKRGAKFLYNTKYNTSTDYLTSVKLSTSKGPMECDFLIGADGPLSSVRKDLMVVKPDFYNMQQYVCKVKDLEQHNVQVFLKPEGFAWVMPESEDTARVGFISKDKPQLTKFIKEKNIKVISKQPDCIIPAYQKISISKEGRYLVGSAALQTNSITFDGLMPGLSCGKELVKSLVDYSSYERGIGKVETDLIIQSKIRNVLNRLDEKKCSDLIKSLNNSKAVIEQYGDIDSPSKMIAFLVLRNPLIARYLL